VRRIIHYIALAILTLVGPVEAMSSVVGAQEMAQLACQCGCGAPSMAACQCHGPAMGPSSSGGSAPSGSPCSTTNRVPCTSQTSSTATAKSEDSDASQKEDRGKRLEPKPWPVSLASHATSVSIIQGSTPSRGASKVHFERPLDRLATLVFFRI
jgi:hypothetical protein